MLGKNAGNQSKPCPMGPSDTVVTSSGTSDLVSSVLVSKCVREMMVATELSVVFYSGVSRSLPFSSQVYSSVRVHVRVCVCACKEETQGDSCHHRFSTQQ